MFTKRGFGTSQILHVRCKSCDLMSRGAGVRFLDNHFVMVTRETQCRDLLDVLHFTTALSKVKPKWPIGHPPHRHRAAR